MTISCFLNVTCITVRQKVITRKYFLLGDHNIGAGTTESHHPFGPLRWLSTQLQVQILRETNPL